MRTKNTVNWGDLLSDNTSTIKDFAFGDTSIVNTRQKLSGESKTQFNRLVKNNGSLYARRLARKALRYYKVI